AADAVESDVAPPIVHDVLRSPGEPLDAPIRAYFEPRFGHDFSKVRVHTDAMAAESASAVSAVAYTVGQDIAFGEGQYSSGSIGGRRVLAHELAHTLQSDGSHSSPLGISRPDDSSEQEANWAARTVAGGLGITNAFRPGARDSRQLRRQVIPVPHSQAGLAGPYSGYQPFPSPPPAPVTQPCLVNAECTKAIPGSSWDFSQQAAAQQAQNKKDIEASPEKAKAAGTARPAVNLKAFADKIDSHLLSGIDQVVVNPAMGDTADAQATNCKGGAPEATGPACIDAPDRLERQAEKFNTTKNPMIDGLSRSDWQTETLSTLTHEVAHTKFAKAKPHGVTTNVQGVANFSPEIFWYELGEINSLLSEYPLHYSAIMASSVAAKDKSAAVRTWIVDYAIGNGQEDLRGMLKKLRCISPCNEVDKGVRKVFADQSAGWTKPQKDLFVAEVSDPEHGLNWPK
ncbi:MAG TPA: DUF4157 domain-containing protein, partial [Terriglobales bacterium]|nr:DUF4157 domain-containing protein [Terriglobales bacterium]